MTMSKGAVGNLINRYRAVLKKCHILNVFGSLAVAGMLVMGGAGVAGAGSLVNGKYSIHEDTTIRDFSVVENPDRMAVIGATSENTSVTVDAGKKLTVTGNPENAGRVYGAYTATGKTLELTGTTEFVLSSTDKQIRVLRAYGDMNIDGDTKIVARGGSEVVVGAEVWDGAQMTFTGKNTYLEANSTGGRIIGVQNFYQGGEKSIINFNADNTVINATNAVDSSEYTQAVLAYQSETNFMGNVDIKVTGGVKDTYGVDVQCDPGNKFDTSVNFSGDTTSIDVTGTGNVYAVRPSGVPGSINFTGKTADIKATSIRGQAAGILAQYGAHLNSAADVSVTAKAAQDAYGVILTEYANHAGNANFEGDLTASAFSEQGDAFGLYNSARVDEATSGQNNDGKLVVNGATNISSSAQQGDAIGLYSIGEYAETKLTGDVAIAATAQDGASYGVLVQEGANVILGGEGKNIILASASSGGVSKTVEALNGADISFAGTQTSIRNDSTTAAKNYGVYLDKAKATFAADSTNIAVKGIGSSGNWGYGVDLWNGATASFTGGAVSVSDYQRDYTAQTLTVRDTSSLVFQNSGNVDIKAESPYGATAIVVKADNDKLYKTAKMTFKNAGNVTITSAIEDPTTLAGTNVVGLMVEAGTAEFTPDVAKVDFVISGQGCDFDGTSYSDGTVAAFVQDAGAKLDVQAKELNINVSAAVDPSVAASDGRKYDDAYGIRVSAGTASVGAATKTAINVNESRGTAYGIAAVGQDSTIEILGDASINAVGRANAYALYADDSGSITFGSNGNSGSLTSSGTAAFIGKGSSVTLNGNTTITAAKALEGEGTVTNAGALTIAGGTVSGFTGTFGQTAGTTAIDVADFGGPVYIKGGALNVAKTLDLSRSFVTVETSGSVVVAAGGTTTFGEAFLTIDGGSVTADAGNFITDEFGAVDGASTSVVGTAGDLYLRFDGKTYTADQYKTAKNALFGDRTVELAQLTLLNGTLKLQEGETVIVGGTADPNTNKVTLSGVTPVVAKPGESADQSNATIASVPDQLVRVVDSGDADKALQTAGSLEIGQSTFSAKGLQVAPADAEAGVVLNLVEGSKITLIGGETEDSGVVVDGNNNAVKTHVVVGDGSTLQLGMAENASKQMASFGTVEVQGKLDVAGNGLDTTHYGYDELKTSHGNAEVNLSNASILASTATLEQGAVNVLNATAHIGTLNPTGGTLFIDPAYVKVDNLSGDTFGSSLLVGDGSVVEIGSIADLQTKAAEAGLNPTAFGSGFTVASGESMLALGKAVTLGAGGKIVVDAGVDKGGNIGGVPVSDSAYFGGNSLLVVDSAIASGDGAIRANSAADTITVKKDAKLYLVDAKANGTYTVASGFGDASSTVEGWTGGDLMVNRLINAERIAGTDGRVTVKTTAKRASVLYPGISIPNTLDRMIGDKQNDVNSGNAGIKFLSRALEPQFLAEGDVIPTLDGAAQLAYAGGVQSSTITVAQAPVRAIQDHLSLAGKVAQKGTNLHENGFDLWANAIYGSNRTRDFSAGSLDAGYNSDFAGGVIGGDWTFDAGAGKGRVGLALNVGAGDTKSRGDFNSTKNDFDFWGMSLYGGWSMDNVNVVADLGYSASKNELKQDIPSSLGLGGRIKGDVDSSVITAGVKAEYMVKTDVLDVMPHIGVRYMAVKTDSFTTKLDMGGDLFHTDSDLQHVWQFPVGVNLSKTIETESGWKVKPQADLSVVPAAGDTKTKIDVRTPGVNASDSMKRRVMDTTSFDGVFGVEVQKDNVSFGLGYNIQASEHQTGQGVTASFMYKF